LSGTARGELAFAAMTLRVPKWQGFYESCDSLCLVRRQVGWKVNFKGEGRAKVEAMRNPIVSAFRLSHFLSELLNFLLFAGRGASNAYHRGRPNRSRRPSATSGDELATATIL
jgi:hypothetical protein